MDCSSSLELESSPKSSWSPWLGDLVEPLRVWTSATRYGSSGGSGGSISLTRLRFGCLSVTEVCRLLNAPGLIFAIYDVIVKTNFFDCCAAVVWSRRKLCWLICRSMSSSSAFSVAVTRDELILELSSFRTTGDPWPSLYMETVSSLSRIFQGFWLMTSSDRFFDLWRHNTFFEIMTSSSHFWNFDAKTLSWSHNSTVAINSRSEKVSDPSTQSVISSSDNGIETSDRTFVFNRPTALL